MEAEVKRVACRDFLKRFMRPGQAKTLTKDELFELAKAELEISRSGFDQAWILAIEEMGRQDWYATVRRSSRKLSQI